MTNSKIEEYRKAASNDNGLDRDGSRMVATHILGILELTSFGMPIESAIEITRSNSVLSNALWEKIISEVAKGE